MTISVAECPCADCRALMQRATTVLRKGPMRRVIIESPFAGNVERNLRYLRACMRDCLLRGEAPFASHGLYTQEGVLDDDISSEREHGIQAGFAWRSIADATIVYLDCGVSRGMEYGIEHAQREGKTIEYRKLGGEWAVGR